MARRSVDGSAPPLIRNYILCAVAGLLWYFQFFFYTMGESLMGQYGFFSWTLHMASIIIFSTLWDFALREWRGSSARTRFIVWAGITLLVGVGYGNALAPVVAAAISLLRQATAPKLDWNT